jgi:predicted CoA-substrate-specific enzyme activase
MLDMEKNGKLTAGIDVGSRTTKAVVWDGNEVLSRILNFTGWSPEESAIRAYQSVIQEIGIDRVERIVVTGYGRLKTPFADQTVTEITAHAKGVSHFLPQTRTLIDIGGQDSKALVLENGGLVLDFTMNDRCAAGSGKFLEFLALTMELPVADFAELAYTSKNPVQISSICTVFAEAEVLSLLAEGVPKEDIARGVHRSIAFRVAQMAKTLQIRPPVVFTGGVARNRCMIQELSLILGSELLIPEFPEFTGALGAAIIAQETR